MNPTMVIVMSVVENSLFSFLIDDLPSFGGIFYLFNCFSDVQSFPDVEISLALWSSKAW
jgi:hypothetical protein